VRHHRRQTILTFEIMLDFTFAQKLTGYTPKKFSWQGVMANGNLIGGFAATLADCERQAKKYEPLTYFVAGPTPLDWPKYHLPPFELNQTIVIR
jgi:hypothetical protein